MVAAPLPVVSSHSSPDEEDECPVCLEPLSSSFRLPGEKPHIVPECGHALHEACFTAVYGPPPGPQRGGGVIRKSNLGVCGVCRRPMKVGDGDGGKSNKLAALTGMGSSNQPSVYPGRDTPQSARSYNRGATPQKPFDPTEDDQIDHKASMAQHDQSHYVVAPSIHVQSEFPTITRTPEANQPLTCLVVVELPGKRANTHVPGSVMHQQDTFAPPQKNGGAYRDGSNHSVHSGPQPGDFPTSPHANSIPMDQQSQSGRSHQMSPSTSRDPLLSSMEREIILQDEDSPFSAITEDLRNRIIDWKGHPLSGLGPLQMYDLLSVRRDALVREFFVYLFKEAIICVVEEKKRSLGRLLSSASAASAFGDGTGSGSINGGSSQRGVLRLKGRIYIRHIRQVTDTSVTGELSLTIDMEDERLDSFILIFKDRSSLETWKAHIQALVAIYQQQHAPVQQQQPEYARSPDLEEFGGSAKAARMLSEEFGGNQKAMRMLSGSTTGTTVSTADSLLAGSARSTTSSNTSYGSAGPRAGLHQKLSTLEEDDELSRYRTPQSLVAPHMSAGPSNSLQPLPHAPTDLVLVISVPGPYSTPSTAALKIRVIKTSLDFILASLSPKDRLSLVTFEVGVGGRVRRTPFLNIGKPQSRQRLQRFMEDIGRRDEFDDEFLVRGSQEEKTDVVTAVNNGLDIVLQRKSRNPVTGFVLVSDSSETTRRAQMDLVLARAEAANVPIHSFGYGRSHDPASLWLISNHTSGTYTFVKDWYDLRDCLAGCIGGMMSIGLMSMKLHLKIVDGNRFRIRKISGGPLAILSSDGRDVDVEVGELRYGERKEMLVELELDNSDVAALSPLATSPMGNGHAPRAMNATDVFNQRMGLDALSIGDLPDLADGMMDRMIDEVPVFEVDGAFFDPNAAKHVSRLAHPVLLTVTLLPNTGSRPRTPAPNGSDPVIVRRRMELLASDMITRMLVLVSRRNIPQAQKLMAETRRILHTVLQNMTQSLPPPTRDGQMGSGRNRKEVLTLSTVRALQSIMQDMQILAEALDEQAETSLSTSATLGRSRSAKVLRDQKSWSGRSAIERLFWTIDSSIELVSRSTDWVARD
ncbi:Pleckstrin homology domain-containing protein [Epithele typhae]|uniref:Pleckstrin homology domain-containing protein n=1 Tax=Epithele typhae TaxID=378194 RepID=UPI002008CC9A|nr:Pleckstrin homology domain-containing protein [Epithele typhae]KAH9921707.1 Pleckstrin homology domain-containing protein [Epithele typhae]